MSHTDIQKALHRHQREKIKKGEELELVERIEKIDELLSDHE